MIVIKEEDSEPFEIQVNAEKGKERERRLEDCSTYLQMCLAELGAHPMPGQKDKV